METLYAPAERTPQNVLIERYEKFSSSQETILLLNSGPELFLILNKNRQIVFANKAVLDFLKLSEINQAFGVRPGEALGCKHAFETDGGCGTTAFCKECGAVNSILEGLSGVANNKECRIVTENNDALDLKVFSTPIEFEREQYVVFAVKDISNEKRRELLERLFFHDILNTAGSLKAYAELMTNFDLDSKEEEEFKSTIYDLSIRLIDEIKSQRILTSAENNELTVHPISIQIEEFLYKIAKDFKKSYFANNKFIEIETNITNSKFDVDETLLSRVIINMLKNALEASSDGDSVTIGAGEYDDFYEFWVHNPAAMPENVRLQIFQRSFSTKGSGRGIGTYSIKLLTERYLNGFASFKSGDELGTIFTVKIPKISFII